MMAALVAPVSMSKADPTIRPDSRLVYVSLSTGNDANDGLTALTPKKTLAAAISLLRDGYPDWLLLRGGDVWEEGLGDYTFRGRSDDEPMVIASYGASGVQASLVPHDSTRAYPRGEHIVTLNVHFSGSPWDEYIVDGWTVLTPRSESRILYVSSSAGDDSTGAVYDLSNAADAALVGPDPFHPAGDVRAFATPGAAYEFVRDGQPDWLLLKRGDEWTIEGHTFGRGVWKKSGMGTGTGRIVVGAYGPDEMARPFLRTDPTDSGLFSVTNNWNPDPVSHVAFTGFHLEPSSRQPDQTPTGIRWLAEGSDILFEDLKVVGYKECTFSNSHKEDIALRRCVFADSWATDGHAQGVYANEVQGLLIEECVFDHNGWNDAVAGAGRTTFNHNMYLSTLNTGVVVRHNLSVRASATGCQARSAGDIVGNVFQADPMGLNFGWTSGVDLPHDLGSIGACLDNVVIDCPNYGYGQWGISVGNIGDRQVTPFRNNLIVGRSDQSEGLVLSGTNNYGIHGMEVTGNVVYNFDRPLRILGTPGVHLTNVRVSRNVFSQVDSDDRQLIEFRDADPSSDTDFRSNRYMSHLPAHRWFRVASDPELSLAEWATVADEADAALDDTPLPDPARDLAAYNASLGGPASLEAFMTEARQQRKGHWRQEYTAQAASAWIRAGFGMSTNDN